MRSFWSFGRNDDDEDDFESTSSFSEPEYADQSPIKDDAANLNAEAPQMPNAGGAIFSFAEHIDPADIAKDDRLHTLVITMGSYADSGHVQRLFNEHVLNALPNHEIGRFDADQLHDYTGRRPKITFEYDRYEDYRAPEMILHQVEDANGQPFLLLTGPEPSMRWERMATSINALSDQLGIDLTVLLQGIPAPAPHTRPVWTHGFATRPELVETFDRLPAVFEMQASFSGMLTVRLGEAGKDVIGIVAQVPHYLSDVEYPDAAIALVNGLNKAAHLDVPLGELPKAAAMTRALLTPQVESSEEMMDLLHELEERYERFMANRQLPAGGAVPTADEIGAEVEEFLRGIDFDGPATDDGPNEPGQGPAGPQLP